MKDLLCQVVSRLPGKYQAVCLVALVAMFTLQYTHRAATLLITSMSKHYSAHDAIKNDEFKGLSYLEYIYFLNLFFQLSREPLLCIVMHNINKQGQITSNPLCIIISVLPVDTDNSVYLADTNADDGALYCKGQPSRSGSNTKLCFNQEAKYRTI